MRRAELSALTVEDLQIRQGHWAIVDLVGKGGHVRTVPDACLGQGGSRSLEGVREGEHGSNLPRSQSAWDALGQGISENVIWYVVRRVAERMQLDNLAPA